MLTKYLGNKHVLPFFILPAVISKCIKIKIQILKSLHNDVNADTQSVQFHALAKSGSVSRRQRVPVCIGDAARCHN